MTDSPRLTVVGGTAAAGNALADKTIPQETFLPLLDAPLDELATYLADHSWEARKDYLNNMMGDSIMNLVKQMNFFEQNGTPKSETMAMGEECMVGLHIKIGQLLNVWGAPEVPPDQYAAALYVLSASPEHRYALGGWMPGGTTSPPQENELFEPGTPLMVFKNMSLACRPGLAECWRGMIGEARS